MRFERTTDMELVRAVMTHPRIWPWITDDGDGPVEAFEPPSHPGIWYVGVFEQGLLGIWMFVPQSSVSFEVHTMLLPVARGIAAEAARQMAAWMWQNSPAHRIVTSVPAFNRLALKLARDSGMTEYGRNPQSFQKNGVLYEQILLGMTRN